MEKGNDLISVIQSFYRWRKAILAITVGAAILSAAISFMVPEYYQSTTTFYAASPDLNNPDRLFGEIDVSYNYYGNDADIDRLRTIAESGDLIDHIVDSFDLYLPYEIEPTNPKARFYVNAKFLKSYEVTRTPYNALQITVEDKEPTRAAGMANAARNKIEEITKGLIKESQKKQLDILVSSINDQNKGISDVENQLAQLGKNFKQSRESTYSSDAPSYESLQKRLEQLSTDQSKLEEKYNKLKGAYDTDIPAIHLVQKATVPVIKSRPVRSLMVISSTLAAFFFSAVLVLILDFYRELDWDIIKG